MKRRDRLGGVTPSRGDTVRWLDGGVVRAWRVERVGRKYLTLVTGGTEVGGVRIPLRRKQVPYEDVLREEA